MIKRVSLQYKPLRVGLQSFCLFLFLSCKAQTPIVSSGLVIAQVSFYKPESKSFVHSETDMPDTRTWYKDSMVIQERLEINEHTMADGKYKRWLELVGYTLIDLRRGWFYHYRTFSDTARLVAKWVQNDSAKLFKYGGAWTFYNEKPHMLMVPMREPTPLTDTLISGVLYKRLTFPVTNGRGGQVWTFAYFRCDKKGTIFRHERVLSEKIGCPMTRIESEPQGEARFALSMEIKFVREHLTAEEMKVFAAWEKNVQENPVK